MTRTLTLVALLAVPAFLPAREEKKPAVIGVQIGRGKEKDIILVLMVFPKSPAQKAGLQPGDMLVKINDVKPGDLETAVKVIRSLEPGKKVKVFIRREGKEKILDLVPEAAGG